MKTYLKWLYIILLLLYLLWLALLLQSCTKPTYYAVDHVTVIDKDSTHVYTENLRGIWFEVYKHRIMYHQEFVEFWLPLDADSVFVPDSGKNYKFSISGDSVKMIRPGHEAIFRIFKVDKEWKE